MHEWELTRHTVCKAALAAARDDLSTVVSPLVLAEVDQLATARLDSSQTSTSIIDFILF